MCETRWCSCHPGRPPLAGIDNLYESLGETGRVAVVLERHESTLTNLTRDRNPVDPSVVESTAENVCRLVEELELEHREATLRWASGYAEFAQPEWVENSDAVYVLMVDLVRGWCPERLEP